MLAGGTDLAGQIDRGITLPDAPRRPPGRGSRRHRGRRRRGADRGDRRRSPRSRRPSWLAPYAAVATAAGLAASPLLRNQGTVGGNLCQHTRCWYYRGEEWTCWLGGGDTCYAQIGDHRKHNLEPGDCISAHPSDLAPALAACGATRRAPLRRRRARAAAARALPPADRGQPLARRARSRASSSSRCGCRRRPTRRSYLRTGERQAFSFPLVSVAAARRGGEVTLVAAGVANIPRALDPADPLAGLPGQSAERVEADGARDARRAGDGGDRGAGLKPADAACPTDAGVVTARMSAMWTSMRAGRAIALGLLRDPRSRRSRPRAPPRPRAHARIRSASGTPSTFASWAALSARPSPPRVGQPHPEQRRRHRDVLVDAGQRQRVRDRVGALRRASASGSGAPFAIASAVVAEHAAHLGLVEAATAAPRGARAGASSAGGRTGSPSRTGSAAAPPGASGR